MDTNILQWNVNGFYNRLENLQKLINIIDAKIICIQESHFKADQCGSLKNFTKYYTNRQSNHASGGVAMYIKQHIVSCKIELQTNLEAIAATCYLPDKLTICNIYLPNKQDVTLDELEKLKQQLPTPFLIVGDLNAHNPIWGSRKTDSRGKIIETFLQDENLYLLNNGSPTHFNSSNATESCIDLTIASASIAEHLEWETSDHLFDSDHFPIIIKTDFNYKSSTLNSEVRSMLNYKKANWELFHEEVTNRLSQLRSPSLDDATGIDNLVDQFNDVIRQSANIAIPTKKIKPMKKQVPWWNSECEEALKVSKHAFNRYKKHKTVENKIEFNKQRAKCRRVFKSSKTNHWLEFVQTLNGNTPSTTVWQKVSRIQGNIKYSRINGILNENGEKVSDPTQLANLFAKIFTKNSSDLNYDPKFLEYKNKYIQPNINITVNSKFNKLMNNPITTTEIETVLKTCKNSSPGPDGIPNMLLRNLPTSGIQFVCDLFNLIFTKHVFPKQWNEATIIPIPKPGKDRLAAKNYRPIALTNNICKLLEKCLNKRLKVFLEARKFFTQEQSGFRSNRSTYDHLLMLENTICEAFQRKHHVIAAALDIEKAYEMLWRDRIIQVLLSASIDNHMIVFIKNFINERRIQVKVNGTVSSKYTLENGIPQGSVLSVTLFLIAINDITKNIAPPIKSR